MRIALVALMTAVASASVAVPALAQTDGPPTRMSEYDVERPLEADAESVKARAQEAIDRRLATIGRLVLRVTDHPHVTGQHHDDLLAELGRSEAGLRALSNEIAQSTTIEELRVLVPKIATDFRIYLVLVPKVHQVLGSDSLVASGARLDGVAESLAAWIDRAIEKGADASVAVAHLEDMTTKLSRALAVGGPVADAVLPLVPADWPVPAADILAQGRADLAEARQFLREARHSAQQAVQALREALGSRSTSDRARVRPGGRIP
jgi:hypothetical protein